MIAPLKYALAATSILLATGCASQLPMKPMDGPAAPRIVGKARFKAEDKPADKKVVLTFTLPESDASAGQVFIRFDKIPSGDLSGEDGYIPTTVETKPEWVPLPYDSGRKSWFKEYEITYTSAADKPVVVWGQIKGEGQSGTEYAERIDVIGASEVRMWEFLYEK